MKETAVPTKKKTKEEKPPSRIKPLIEKVIGMVEAKLKEPDLATGDLDRMARLLIALYRNERDEQEAIDVKNLSNERLQELIAGIAEGFKEPKDE